MAILNHGQSIVMDPTLLEESIAEGNLIITINHLGEICTLTKTGGILLDNITVLKCLQLAKNKTEELRILLQETCDNMKRRRKKNIIIKNSDTYDAYFIDSKRSHYSTSHLSSLFLLMNRLII
jgi:uncharacterized protein YaaQ